MAQLEVAWIFFNILGFYISLPCFIVFFAVSTSALPQWLTSQGRFDLLLESLEGKDFCAAFMWSFKSAQFSQKNSCHIWRENQQQRSRHFLLLSSSRSWTRADTSLRLFVDATLSCISLMITPSWSDVPGVMFPPGRADVERNRFCNWDLCADYLTLFACLQGETMPFLTITMTPLLLRFLRRWIEPSKFFGRISAGSYAFLEIFSRGRGEFCFRCKNNVAQGLIQHLRNFSSLPLHAV